MSESGRKGDIEGKREGVDEGRREGRNERKKEGRGVGRDVIGLLILTTNLAACVCVCAQNFTNFCPYALISSPNVPKILFA